jgi:hypothetical protein
MAANQFLIDAKELTTPKKQLGVKDEKPSLTQSQSAIQRRCAPLMKSG